jgi:hypothetical protein
MALSLKEKTNIRNNHCPQGDNVTFYEKVDTAIRKLAADIKEGVLTTSSPAFTGKKRVTEAGQLLEFGMRVGTGCMTQHLIDDILEDAAMDVDDVNNETQMPDTLIINTCRSYLWCIASQIGDGII